MAFQGLCDKNTLAVVGGRSQSLSHLRTERKKKLGLGNDAARVPKGM